MQSVLQKLGCVARWVRSETEHVQTLEPMTSRERGERRGARGRLTTGDYARNLQPQTQMGMPLTFHSMICGSVSPAIREIRADVGEFREVE